MTTAYYPASPTENTKKLTALTPSYQFRAFLAILAIILFFVLYAALVTALGFLLYGAIMYPMQSINKLTILVKIGAVAGAAMLFAFTLKFIFKLKNHKPANRIKLKPNEHPELWKFINQICQETGAPKPKSIYVDPDVNAYVSYTNIWLSLFLPVKKDLTIGLGLVSCLNLSEFKAVISHEFGHFAQSSMKIGSYINSANTIIHDMIFSRDKWDETLDQWRASDIRLSAAAWVITPIIWLIRQALNLFYQFLNIMYSSLSREMEFNADKVAVSTSGSDAIISALWKLDPGVTSWNGTVNHAYLATQKNLFVKNLYVNNSLSLDRSADEIQTAIDSLPNHTHGGKQYFSTSENSKVSMYASHPPNDQREASAKFPYVACQEDKRSPWVLFGEKEKLQEEMTLLVYDQYLGKQPKEFISPNALEDFIEAETAHKNLAAEYLNTFENRFFHIPEQKEIRTIQESISDNKEQYLNKLKEQLATLMAPIQEMESLMAKAQQIAQGTTKETSFSFKGKVYNKKQLEEGYNVLLSERENHFNNSFKEWDSQFVAFHLLQAQGTNRENLLNHLLQQHASITHFYRTVSVAKNSIFSQLHELQNRGEVMDTDVIALAGQVNRTYTSLNDPLQQLGVENFVPLPNIDSPEELRNAIIEGAQFLQENTKMFENGGFDRIVFHLDQALQHCQRIEQKNMGMILKTCGES